MKYSNDDLIRLAFGELSADEARALETRAASDRALREELDAFRDLRASLQHLPPPPPDTLSPERLRAAILDRELKGERRSPSRAYWSWAPAFALAAAVAFVMVRPQPQAMPQIVAFDSSVEKEARKSAFDDQIRFESKAFEAPAPQASAMMAAADLAPAPISRRVRSERKRVRVAVSETKKALPSAVAEAFGNTALVARMEPETIAPPPSAVLNSEGYGALNEGVPIVLISNQRDAGTGAPAATELEATNVLVGG